jgi:GTP cyclohydrolase I
MTDQEKVKKAVRLFLEGIGEDPDREGLAETPDRIARMCEELYGGTDEAASAHLQKRFRVENNEMVLEKDIPFYSTCEHHILPFFGKVHIAYVPDGEVVGLSKLARMVEAYARRLQIQERLTAQIADKLMEELNPKGRDGDDRSRASLYDDAWSQKAGKPDVNSRETRHLCRKEGIRGHVLSGAPVRRTGERPVSGYCGSSRTYAALTL